MTPSHVLITRFSYRGKAVFKHVDGPTFPTDEDPLEPARLELRFELFELACLPSVMAQTDQDFIWVLLVDAAMPATYSARLRSLVSRRERSFVHVFDRESDLGRLDWLRPYLPEGAQRATTTNLDDDDALPDRFTAALHEHLRELGRGERPPPIGIVGARQIVQWDLLRSAVAPLGRKAPWHRDTRVASVGFSLHCSFPEFNFCVLGLRHREAESYLDFSSPSPRSHVAWVQGEVLRAAQEAGIDLRAWPSTAFFHDISREVGPVLMTNHRSNAQAARLLEVKPGSIAIAGPADFPGFSLDWGKVSGVLAQSPD